MVCKEPRVEEPDGLSEKYPRVYPACAVTRALSKKVAGHNSSVEKDVNNPDFIKPPELTSSMKNPKVSEFVGPLEEERVTTKHLIAEQSKDVSLSPLFAEILQEEELDEVRVGYFDRDGVLMRKLHSRATSGQENWPSISKIVITVTLRKEIG